MPFVHVNGVRLYYRIYDRTSRATHEPLVLIAGLGFATWCWFKQIPVLARHYQVIVFDNRGSGRSEKPQEPYTVATLADDAAGLLDALDIPRAHVLGTSLGGFVAQELALRHPERVAKLILCCTSFGGARSVPMTWPTLKATMGWGAIDKVQAIHRGITAATSNTYRAAHPTELAQIIRWRQRDHLSRGDYLLQIMAGVRFDAARRAHAIAAPALIIHGAEDQIVPVANARLLAQTIPNAELRIIHDSGHLVFIEQAAQVNQAIVEFLGPMPLPWAQRTAELLDATTRSLVSRWRWFRERLARSIRTLTDRLRWSQREY